MAKLLIVDTDNVGLSLAWRSAQAGHEVRWYVKPKKCNHPDTGRGFKGVTKVENFVPSMMWADLVICTSNDDYLDRLDFFKKKGANVFAPTTASANLEISRKDGMELMEKCGIETAPYKTFKRMEDAEAHVKKTEERFVFKTLGDNEDKALTYVSKNAADMLEWMKRIRESGAVPKGDVMLQTFIDGIEFGVSRFMGQDGFVGQWNESFEHKKHMSGNHGCNTGEMGTIAAFTKDSKIGKDTLAKCEAELVKLGHLGDVAIGFMIEKATGKPYPTEWTCRFGWPIENMMIAATKGDPIQWMIDAKNGKDTTSFSEDIGCCLVLTHGDFPHGNKDRQDVTGVPIYGVTKGNKKYLHPQGVKIDIMHDMEGDKIVERPLWNSAGDYLAVVTGFGNCVKQAAERTYKTAKQLHVSNMQLRDDVGEGMEEQLPELHKFGYATHFTYDGKGDRK
jgi:phosphoribosylamine-glycine ligase